MSMGTEQSLEEGSISDADFARISGLVRDMTGIDLQPHKRTMVASRLSKRLRATGISSVRDYCDFLQSKSGDQEQTGFISAYTTNMTRFNREGHHFEHLASDVLPRLMDAARRGARVRIWSAGCSSGEEPYGIAFNVLDICPEADRLDVKILASDIDIEILNAAKSGLYSRSQTVSLPNDQASKYFEPHGQSTDSVRVCDKARSLISFRQLNLHGDWPFKGTFDVIMCRNVAIYFDEPTQSRLWTRFQENLAQDGLLYLGHSEGIEAEHAKNLESVGRGVFRINIKGAASSHSSTAKNMGKTS